jgi:uncharacterized protein YicC (UPF0701 family)
MSTELSHQPKEGQKMIALIVVIVIAIGLAIFDIRSHIEQVVAERCDKLEQSIAELKPLIENSN